MTNKQHPALFDWATELLDAQGHVTLSAQEANEIGARLRSMGEKLKAYEDLDKAASDVQLLRMGYAAARLEIESLQARIKTMAEEHADELTVAHLDGRMRAAQPAGAQQSGDERAAFEQWSKVTNQGYDLARNVSGKLQTFESTETEHAWRGFFHGLRASHGQAPAQAAPADVAGPSAPGMQDAIRQYTEAQDALDNREYAGINAEPYDKLLRARNAARRDLEAALAAAPTTQPAPQQEAQEPVAWMATPVMPSGRGITTVFCSDRSMAEQWDHGGHREYGRMLVTPLYTAPQTSPASQGDALDAERYRWLRERMLGIDFDWNESGITALSFEMPDGCAYGGCCNQNIDAAMNTGGAA